MLNFNKLVLVPTYVCNLRCRHCYVEAGDPCYQENQQSITSVERIERYLSQVPTLTNVGNSVHFAGGEITLFQDEFFAMLSLARKYGLESSLVTNGTWAKDQDTADFFVHEVVARGLREIHLSMSIFHQEFCDIKHIVYAIRACKKHQAKIVLRPITTRSHSVAEAIQHIPDSDLGGVSINVAPCCSIGRAKDTIARDDFFAEEVDYRDCHRCLFLTILNDGSVYPCCAGSDTTRALCLGNADDEPLSEIIARAEINPLLNILIYQGTRYIAEILRDAGGKDFTGRKHTGMCHLCNELFIDDAIACQVREAVYAHIKRKAQHYKQLSLATTA